MISCIIVVNHIQNTTYHYLTMKTMTMTIIVERPCPGEVFGYDNSEDNDEAASDYALKINESSD